MKKRKLILIGILLWNFNSVFGQICGTPHPVNPTIYPQESVNAQARGSSSELCIDMFFHIVRNTNGTNAFSVPNTEAIVNHLNQFYSPHNIIINNAGIDYINDTNFLTVSLAKARILGQVNNRNYAINYYIVGSLGFTPLGQLILGTANSTPSNNLIIRRDRVLASISPHELGHCLNLYHTFQGTAFNTNGCAELTPSQKPNCNECGDMVCDTPADDGQKQKNDYNPDLTNIMSYYQPADHFTNGQGDRMRYAIQNESVLQNIPTAKISAVDNLCYPQTTTITLSNRGSATTIWTSSTNVRILSRNNNSITVRASSPYSTGAGWVRATLNNGVVLTEAFNLGGIFNAANISLYSSSYRLNNYQWNKVTARYNGRLYNSPNYRWEWRVPASSVRQAWRSYSYIDVRPNTTVPSIYIKVRVCNNVCGGCSGWKGRWFTIRPGRDRGDGIDGILEY